MRFGRNRGPGASRLEFNFTPMIDMIFTLTVFYMLVTRFYSAEQVSMRVPQPERSQAQVQKMSDRVVVNCRLADPTAGEEATTYSIGPNQPESLSMIADRLAAMKQQVPELKVIVRADRRLPYSEVRTVMQVLAHHHIEMLNVAALIGEER